MLILEGSDCLGKTTFAKLLLDEANSRNMYPTFYSHMSRPNSVFDFFLDYKDMITTFAIQDRFHLGGIVWHDAISQAKLEIIEGWLRSVGSMIIVFYTKDHRWFEEKIKNDKRENLLDIDTMLKANKRYVDLVLKYDVLHPIIDTTFNIKSYDDSCPQYPNRNDAKQIIDKWFERLGAYETFN